MIVFRKLKTKKINPFKVLDDESEDLVKYEESLKEIEGSDWKQKKTDDKKEISDYKVFNSRIYDSLNDASLIEKPQYRYDHFKNNRCKNSLSENKISSNKKKNLINRRFLSRVRCQATLIILWMIVTTI